MPNIKRTYPTPDTARENCGPRERALAVFKYLLDLEPEQAAKHPRFQLIVNGFEQQRILGQRQMYAEWDEAGAVVVSIGPPKLLEPLEPELTSVRDLGLPEPK